MDKKKIIIDTDIGDDIDDAFALALAVKMDCIDLLGVTTVYRNSLQRGKIAAGLLRALGREDVPVFIGNDYPRKEKFAIEPFEQTLSDGRPQIPHYLPEFDEITVCGMGAAEFIAEQADAYEGEITVLAIGPLTNLADVVEKYPNSFQKIKEIVCMGGSFAKERAEWNIRCDPESAEKVLNGGVPMKLIGVDVTSYTAFTDCEIDRIDGEQGEAFQLLSKMMHKWMDTHPGRKPTMHDGLTVAELIGGYCDYETSKVAIPLFGRRRAYTVCTEEGNYPVVEYAVSLQREKFMNDFMNTLLNK
ncbi:MAG: nucleoside hydrolase [Clostridia bacterium]|nr:nucleoside hydrolase [Clostridia bacterium]